MVAPRQPIEIREFSAPELPAGSALLRTERSEVCGTDVHLWHGRLSGVPYPIIPGHVSAGTLQAVRGPLTGLDGSTLREGDRVAFFDVHRTCGRCRACTVHRTPTRCVARRVYGITDSAAEGLFGGWSQAIYLEPGVGLARLPDRVGFDDYIGGGCGLLTAVHILERAALRPGDSVLVQGTGAVGLSAIALARLGGASTIIAIGAPGDRLEMARRMGADHVFDVTTTTPEERLAAVQALSHGEGVDVVLEAAGAAAAISEGLNLARDGGRYVIAGHYTDVGRQRDQRASPDQQEASRDPWLLGQRGRSLPEGAHVSRALCRPGAVAGDWRQNVSAEWVERSARGRRGDANHQGTRGSVGNRMRRTKIVATLGPASNSPEMLTQLIESGVDVFRLNFSHGTREAHAEVYHRVRAAAANAGRIVAIMQDLSGPKIRTTTLEGGTPITLAEGSQLRIRGGEGIGRTGLVFTPYVALVRSARPGDRLLLDDGRIELRVTSADDDELVTTVVNGGVLAENKGINAPGIELPASAITAKDAVDLRFGLELGVDYIALSFVQTADDLLRAAPDHGRSRQTRPPHRQDRASGRAAEPARDSGAGPGCHGGAWGPRPRDAARAGASRPERDHSRAPVPPAVR